MDFSWGPGSGSCNLGSWVVTMSIVKIMHNPRFTCIHSSPKETQLQKCCVSFGKECICLYSCIGYAITLDIIQSILSWCSMCRLMLLINPTLNMNKTNISWCPGDMSNKSYWHHPIYSLLMYSFYDFSCFISFYCLIAANFILTTLVSLIVNQPVSAFEPRKGSIRLASCPKEAN